MKAKYAFVAGLLCASGYVSGQSIIEGKKNEDLSLLLEEVVVTGTGTDHYLKEAPVQTEVITKRALEQYQARTIEELLNGLSPSISFMDGSMGNHIQLNGLSNDYILIMIDGKRMNGDVGGQNDLNMLNPANIERIEIVKGAASSLYGSDAIAGVINIITKKNLSKQELTSTSRVGEYGDVRESISLGWTFGKVKSVTALDFHHTDGWRNTDLQWNQQQLKPGSTQKTVNRSTNYTLSEKLEWEVNKRLTLSASANYYERWVARPHGQWSYLANDFYYRNYGFATNGKYKLKGRNYLTADLSYDRYGYFYDYKLQEVTDYFLNGDRITYYPGQRIKQSVQQQLLGQAKGVFYLGDTHILNTGVEYLYQHLESPHHIEGDKASIYTLALYAQDEWTLQERWVMTVGARGTLHKETGFNVSPKVSLLYKWKDLNLRASYALGYKAPTVKELYYNYTASLGGGALTAYHGNTDLKAQTSQYASLSWEYAGKKLQASVTGYLNLIRNMIELVEITPSAEEKLDEIEKSKVYRNLTKARIWGIDCILKYQPSPAISLNAGYSFTDPKAQYPNQGIHYMEYIPINATSQHAATLTASWQHSWKRYRLGVSANGRYQSTKHYIVDNNADAFQTWRLNTAHTLLGLKTWTLTFNVGVDNLFNYIDRTPFGRNRATSTPGRNYYASLLIKYKSK